MEIDKYDTITLEEMNDIRLMNRIDTKFVTTVPILHRLLALAADDYRVQETAGKRILDYYTLYFDTPAHSMYIAHQNGKKPRQKIRIRRYVDSDICFLEVKNKNAKGRTKKKRIQLSDVSHSFNPESRDFLTPRCKYDINSLRPQIENFFSRITLVNRQLTERITIDTNLKFHNFENDVSLDLSQFVIIELKRDGNKPSPISRFLRQLRVQPSRFSKYCVGCAKTDTSLKQNRFKPLFSYLTKLLSK